MPIGPELPSHLQQKPSDDVSVDTTVAGPQIPPGHLNQPDNTNESEESEDDYLPELPPDLAASRSAGPSALIPPGSVTNAATKKRVVGPSLPSYPPIYDPKYHDQHDNDDNDDDDDFGPKPLPAGVQHAKTDAVQDFLEREERRRNLAEEAAKPKALQRDEWMLVPPSSSNLLGNLDPTKLKARQFSRSAAAPTTKKVDNSLWTETPAERQQRLVDEVSGKKRRAVDTANEEASDESKRRRKGEDIIRRGVEEYTQKLRGPSLITQHEASGKVEAAKEKEKDNAIWEHSRDMSLGGRLMDDSKRTKLIREAKGLGDRFGTGKSGGFL